MVCREVHMEGFVSQPEIVGAIKLHYLLGGSGPAVILLHGWPQPEDGRFSRPMCMQYSQRRGQR